MELEIIKSGDGSNTIFRPDLNETYHSNHGAVQESRHVFIDKGLNDSKKKDEISVLEIGFGTGLNAFLSIQWSLHMNQKLVYHTLEPYPIEQQVIQKLNYPQLIVFDQSDHLWEQLHVCEWEREVQLTTNFTIVKKCIEVQKIISEKMYDIVFFDAFAPGKQAEMWDVKTLNNVFKAMKIGGALVTYCSNGQFKRNLKEIGFSVEPLDGPPGKREMVIAYK